MDAQDFLGHIQRIPEIEYPTKSLETVGTLMQWQWAYIWKWNLKLIIFIHASEKLKKKLKNASSRIRTVRLKSFTLCLVWCWIYLPQHTLTHTAHTSWAPESSGKNILWNPPWHCMLGGWIMNTELIVSICICIVAGWWIVFRSSVFWFQSI